jgi:hypothetical protein
MEKNRKHLKPPPFGCEEEYFWGEIYTRGGQLVGRVKCKLILNRMNHNIRPTLFLYPADEERSRIFHHFEVEVKGGFENVAQEKTGEIHIPRAYMERSSCVSYAPSWDESIIEVFPGEIYLKHYLKEREIGQAKSVITFFMTDNEIINPWGTVTRSYTGEVKLEFEPRVILNYGQGWTAKVERHYYHCGSRIEGVDGDFSSSQLVLILEKDEYIVPSISEIWQKANWVNSLLWYLSFGTRRRTMWLRWESVVGNEYLEYFRGIGVPEEGNRYDSLVERSSIKEFLQHCLAYEERENHLDLYLPIIYLVSSLRMGITVEMEFLSLFISLEAMLNLFMKSRGKGKVFSDTDWDMVFAKMKTAGNGLGLNDDSRGIGVRSTL